MELVKPNGRAAEINNQDWTEKFQEAPEIAQPKNSKDRSSHLKIDTKYQMNRENFLSLLRKSRKLKALLKMATGVEDEIEGYIRLHWFKIFTGLFMYLRGHP